MLKNWAAPVAALCALFNATALGVDLSTPPAMPEPASILHFSAIAKPLPGYRAWCKQNRTACKSDQAPRFWNAIPLTRENWEILNAINSKVNKAITYKSDRTHYGVEDKWTIPKDGYGDCEDYALLKEKILIEQYGFDKSSLTKVALHAKSGETDGHMVLAAWTTKGVFILDTVEGVYAADKLDRRIQMVQHPTRLSDWYNAALSKYADDIQKAFGANKTFTISQRATLVLVPRD